MNNLIFGEHPYKKFANTFLAKVLIVFKFGPATQMDFFDERMDKYSMESFGIAGPKGTISDTVRLASTDGRIVFQFSNDFASVEIAGIAYESFFNSIIPQAFKLKSYVKDVIGVERINTVSIRKLNIWQFENKKTVNAVDVKSVQDYVFSDDFNQLENNVELNEDEKKLDYFKKHRWEDNRNLLELRTAFMEMASSTKDKLIYGLVLDSERVESPIKGILCEEIETVLKNMNMDLYNAYMWSISEPIKNIMNIGKEKE